jgi:fibronectin type 3 domain-containing protein
MRRNAPRVFATLVPQALALLLVACGGDDKDDNPPPPPPAADTTAPTVPAGLAGTPLSGTQISLTWTASVDAGVGVAGYRVYRDAGATPIANVSVPNYTDTGLTSGTAYSYTVRAYDAATPANESALSSPVSVTTMNAPVIDITPPSVPAGVTAAPQSTSQILISWSASTDAGGAGLAGYRVFRNGGATAIATVTATNYTDAGLAANTLYSYTVVAFDAATV